jgi:hypothetical protein
MSKVTSGDGEALFQCDECARRLIFNWHRGSWLVLERGDELVQHSGGLGMTATVTQ